MSAFMSFTIGNHVVINTSSNLGASGDPALDVGLFVDWASNTYFDSANTQASATSDLASSYSTNNLVWQPFYAHQAISLLATSGVSRWGTVAYSAGSNSFGLRSTVSTANNTNGSFSSDIVTTTNGSVSYSAGVLNQKTITTTLNIPAKRYFMLGVVGGPYYHTFKTMNGNRTAYINSQPVVTVLNHVYHAAWPSGPTTGIPTQVGGAGTFTKVNNAVLQSSYKFTLT